MLRTLSVVAVIASTLMLASCSVNDDPPESVDVGPPTTDAVTTSAAPTSSTIAAPTGVELSTAVAAIGPATYEFEVTCVREEGGDVVVAGIGEDVNGLATELYVQAYREDPYVSIVVGSGERAVRYEPDLGPVLEFGWTDNQLEFGEIVFVSDLDLESAESTFAGDGELEVECLAYVAADEVEAG